MFLHVLSIFVVLAGCIFLANAAYVQATLMWCLLTPFLFKYNRYCHQRFGKAVQRMPLETAAAADKASVDPAVYLPPALRSTPAMLLLPVLWQSVRMMTGWDEMLVSRYMQMSCHSNFVMRMRLMRGFDLVQAWICGLVPRVWQGMGALECSLVHMLTSWTCPALDSKSRVVMGTVLQNLRCKLMAGRGAGSSWLSRHSSRKLLLISQGFHLLEHQTCNLISITSNRCLAEPYPDFFFEVHRMSQQR
jgi:hypothetical protein